MSAFATTTSASSVTNLLNQEITTLEQERRAIEKELSELAQGKIKLELNGKQIEMELGSLDLGSDLTKSRLQLELKLARALTENPLGEKLIRSFMKEEQLRQVLDLPSTGGGVAALNTTLNQRAARIGCGSLVAAPALTLVGIVVLGLGLVSLFGNSATPKAPVYPTPSVIPSSPNSSLYPANAPSNFTSATFRNAGSNSQPQTDEFDSADTPPSSLASAKLANPNSSSRAVSSYYRQPTGLPSNPLAGQPSSVSSNSNASLHTAKGFSKINLGLNPARSVENKVQPKLAQTEGAGEGDGNGDEGESPARVGLPPSSAGGYNGPHGTFLPPSLLSVTALGLAGVPVVRALTQEGQDEQTGQATLSLLWPRPFEVAHFGAFPGELGNCVILGTQSSLGIVRRLQLNDEIRLSDRKGNLFVYRVVAFSPTGQSERVVDLSQESWVFDSTPEAILTILITPPQDIVPLSKSVTNGQEQPALDDLTTTHRLAYRAVLSIYAPIPPTPFGTPVAVKSQVWQVPTPTPTPTSTPPPATPTLSIIATTTTPTPTATTTAQPSSTATATISPTTLSEVATPTQPPLPDLPHAGDGSCANGGCDDGSNPGSQYHIPDSDRNNPNSGDLTSDVTFHREEVMTSS